MSTTARLGSAASRSRWSSPLRHPSAPLVAFVGVLVLAYGFEIFSFNLTLDEELFGAGYLNSGSWVEEGRWAMAALSLLIPSPVTPVVSTAIGVVLSGAAWWLIARRFLLLPAWPAAFAASLAGTVPVVAFIMSFSTIAYGVGVGNLLLFAFVWGLQSRSWMGRAGGALALAAAVGVYDPFAAAGAALVIALVLKHPSLRTVLLGIASLAGALLASRLLGWALLAVTGLTPSEHIVGRVDLAGLAEEPLARTRVAISNVWHTITLSTDLFGLHSPWLAIVVTILGTAAIVGALRAGPARRRVLRIAALLGLALIPVVVEMLSPDGVRLRAMVYVPVIILVLSWAAGRGIRALPSSRARLFRPIVAVLVVLAIVGSSMISNRLFASAATTYALDQRIAFLISFEKDRFVPNTRTTLPLVVGGTHDWPGTELRFRRETLGASFFSRPSDRSVRIVDFLRSEGIWVRVATPSQTETGRETLEDMPVYPNPGWVTVEDGILLVKFSE